MSLLSKIFSVTYQVSGLVSVFLGLFNGMVSVYVSEKVIVEFCVLRPFQRYKIYYHS